MDEEEEELEEDDLNVHGEEAVESVLADGVDEETRDIRLEAKEDLDAVVLLHLRDLPLDEGGVFGSNTELVEGETLWVFGSGEDVFLLLFLLFSLVIRLDLLAGNLENGIGGMHASRIQNLELEMSERRSEVRVVDILRLFWDGSRCMSGSGSGRDRRRR